MGSGARGDALHRVRGSHDGDLPLEDVGVVHETRGEALDGVTAQLWTSGAARGEGATGVRRDARRAWGGGWGGGRLTGTRAREARGGARDRGSGNAARGSRGRNRANARGSEGAPLSCFRRRSTAWSDMTDATWGDARGDRDVRASARTPPEGVRRAGPVRASGVRVSSPRSEGSRGRAGRASKAARVRSTTDARRPGEGGPSRRGTAKIVTAVRAAPPRADFSETKKIRSRWPTPRGAGGGAHSSWRTRRTRARRCGRPTAAAWASLSR